MEAQFLGIQRKLFPRHFRPNITKSKTVSVRS